MNPPRPTQKDIAEAAGVHRATVSMALRNHPAIKLETRKRIMEIAEGLGYTPDPMLSALAAYRNRSRPQVFHGTLAWVVNSVRGWNWKRITTYLDYYQGAVDCAASHGYTVEIFDLGMRDVSQTRLANILLARGVNGLLMCPQPVPDARIHFPWEKFSAVTFGHSLLDPQLHSVSSNQFRSSMLIMEKLYDAGYRRIGMIKPESFDERTGYNYRAGFLLQEAVRGGGAPIPPIRDNYEAEYFPEILAWIRKYKIDAIVATGQFHLEQLRGHGFRIPQDFGFACYDLDGQRNLSGIEENCRHVGKIAADFLVSMIQRGERGIPEMPQRLLIEAQWIDGGTTRPVVPSASSSEAK